MAMVKSASLKMSPNSADDNELRSSHESRLTLWLRPLPMPPPFDTDPAPNPPPPAGNKYRDAAEAIDDGADGEDDGKCRSRVSSTRLFSRRRRRARTRRSTSMPRTSAKCLTHHARIPHSKIRSPRLSVCVNPATSIPRSLCHFCCFFALLGHTPHSRPLDGLHQTEDR